MEAKTTNRNLILRIFDLMYAYKVGPDKAVLPIINGEIEFGLSNTLTLSDKSTGTVYKLVQLK